jgi:hypothetical protein
MAQLFKILDKKGEERAIIYAEADEIVPEDIKRYWRKFVDSTESESQDWTVEEFCDYLNKYHPIKERFELLAMSELQLEID